MKLTREQVMVANEMRARGTSVRQLAKQLGVQEGTLRYRFRKQEEGPAVDGRSRQATALDGYENGELTRFGGHLMGNQEESTMPGSHSPYPPEFRRQMVELVRSGRTPEELAREFEPSAGAIRNWVRQADLDEGRRSDGLRTDERGSVRISV